MPLEMSPGREAACRAVFGTWGFSRTMHGKTAPSCGLHSQGGVRGHLLYNELTCFYILLKVGYLQFEQPVEVIFFKKVF